MTSESILLAEIEAETLRHLRTIAQLRRALAAARAHPVQSGHRPPDLPSSAAQAIQIVHTFTGVTPAEILGRTRTDHVATARHITWYLIRSRLPVTPFNDIARYFHRDHATIIHGIRHIENLRETDPDFAHLLARILRAFDPQPN